MEKIRQLTEEYAGYLRDESRNTGRAEGIAFPGRIPFLELPVSPEQEIARVRFTGRARFLSPEEMEETLARAVRVPDYAAVFQELEAQKRKKIWERYLPVEEEEGR